MRRDYDLVNIVDSIYKLKAAVKILVNEENSIFMRMKYQYQLDKNLKPAGFYSPVGDFLDEDHIFELD